MEATYRDKLDDVDIFLASQDGQVQRGKDPNMCRHGSRQKCTHCLPVDPYDEEYLKSKDIKHMSFHSYIKKITAGHGKGTHLKKPLENMKCSIDLNCNAHKPFPKGICTKCKPPVMTLNRQRFRHVDNVQIENEDLVNDFLNFWRVSGHQRMGFLIGKYQPFTDVPLGIKATVAAIYEPAQAFKSDGIGILDDPNEEKVDRLLSWLGLQRVGWIFTDLWTANAAEGTVHCTRHKDSFFLTAEECITAGSFQNKFKNVTEYCSDRYFGSKFVTIVASGDESMHVNFHGYQVSNQCSALVEADILCPTLYTPELAFIREKPLSETHYITGVQFTEKNEYGADVQKDGRPLPVEYLLVDVPTGMPKEPHFTFHASKKANFAIENRKEIGHAQGGANFATYCAEFSLNQFLEQATNFHFLFYLITNDTHKVSDEWIKKLCIAIVKQDREEAMNWARDCEDWHQLVNLSYMQSDQVANNENSGDPSAKWSCSHCTFENEPGRGDCTMCGLPANA